MTDDDTDDCVLTDMQYRLYNLLHRNRDKDVLIRDMYYAIYGVPGEFISIRDMQQKLAPIIARINTKLTTGVIKPGQLKQTYRLLSQ